MLVWGIRTDLFYWESALGFANLHFATFMKICGDSLKYRKWPSKETVTFKIDFCQKYVNKHLQYPPPPPVAGKMWRKDSNFTL